MYSSHNRWSPKVELVFNTMNNNEPPLMTDLLAVSAKTNFFTNDKIK